MSLLRIVFGLMSLFILVGCINAYPSERIQISNCVYHSHNNKNEIRAQFPDYDESRDFLNRKANEAYKYYQKTAREGARTKTKPIVIRFSEAGNLTNHCDLEYMIRAIDRLEQDKIILVFMHGWKNDSGSARNKYFNFNSEESEFLETDGSDYSDFARFAAILSNEADLPVVPVFLSWKGSTGLGSFDVFSFWSRKGAADRIARSSELGRVLGTLQSLRKGSNETESHLYFVGHSFGSRILLQSFSHELVSRTFAAMPTDTRKVDEYYDCENPAWEAYWADENRPEQAPNMEVICKEQLLQIDNIEWPADKIYLFNPAVEAASYSVLDETNYSMGHYSKEQDDILYVIQSENDAAVGRFFPAGQFFWGFLNRSRITGVGFYPHSSRFNLESGGTCIKSTLKEPEIYVGSTRDSPFKVYKASSEVLDGHTWIDRDDLELIASTGLSRECSSGISSWLMSSIIKDARGE